MPVALPEPFGTDPLTHDRVVVKNASPALKQYPYLYQAGTEPLASDEMQITALGTGYSSRRGQDLNRRSSGYETVLLILALSA